MISNLGDKYTKLREDLNHLKQNRNTDLGMTKGACSKIDRIGSEIDDINEKLNVLKQRTDTDYTQFSKPIVDTSKGPDDAPPPCETCKWKGFIGFFGDTPCSGCTAEDHKMYKPKEN